MDSYIVRIIRRKDKTESNSLALDGVVEDAEGNTRLPFHTPEQLWLILGGASNTKHQGNKASFRKRR